MTINAEVGSSTANSYVTLAEASSYFEDRTHSDEWDNFNGQTSALVTASSMLDWYVKWKGTKASESQSMQWPRTGVLRPDGSEVDDDIVPNDVKVAVYELALSSLDSDRTEDDPLGGVEQLKASSLMIKASAGGSKNTSPDVIPEKIWRILSDLKVTGGIGTIRLMRA